MRLNKTERKHKKVKTTEILDSLAKELDYANTKECEKREEYREELEEREPYKDFKVKIDRMEHRIQRIETMLKRLMVHSHDKNEKVVVDIDSDNVRAFL